MIDDNENSADETASGNGAASGDAPSVDEMINASFSANGTGARDTSLDTFRINIEPDNEPEPVVIIGDAPRRGRPPGSGKTATKKKAQLAKELEAANAEIAAMKARQDTDKIDNLANQVEMACFLIFGTLARKRGDHWKLTKDEGEQIGQTGALALAPYADRFQKEAPWVMFGLALGGAFYQRIEKDKELVAALPPETQS